MKLKIVMTVSLFSFFAYGYQQKETYLEAAEYFNQGEYDKALDRYRALKVEAPEIFYNKAVMFCLKGDYVRALAPLRMAQRYGDYQLLKKVDRTLKKVQDACQLPHDSFWYWLLVVHQSFISLFVLQIVCIALFMTWYLFSWVSYSYTAIVRRVLFLLAIITFFEIGLFYIKTGIRYGVVIKDDTFVYVSPYAEVHEVGKLSAGQEIKLVDKDKSWYKIQVHDIQGWVRQEELDVYF